jgi:hypothetical protein
MIIIIIILNYIFISPFLHLKEHTICQFTSSGEERKKISLKSNFSNRKTTNNRFRDYYASYDLVDLAFIFIYRIADYINESESFDLLIVAFGLLLNMFDAYLDLVMPNAVTANAICYKNDTTKEENDVIDKKRQILFSLFRSIPYSLGGGTDFNLNSFEIIFNVSFNLFKIQLMKF